MIDWLEKLVASPAEYGVDDGYIEKLPKAASNIKVMS